MVFVSEELVSEVSSLGAGLVKLGYGGMTGLFVVCISLFVAATI
jgi:hypothetical protein